MKIVFSLETRCGLAGNAEKVGKGGGCTILRFIQKTEQKMLNWILNNCIYFIQVIISSNFIYVYYSSHLNTG